MNIAKTLLITALGLTATLAASAQAKNSDYAERLYQDYAAATGSKVSFALTTLRAGSLKDLEDGPMRAFTGIPSYSILVSEEALKLEGAQFVTADLNEIYLEDLDFRVESFEKSGFPLESGAFRQLSVAVTVDEETRTHRAMEFCWSAQGHCVVYDPSVDFIDSVVNSMRATKASGWAPTIIGEPSIQPFKSGNGVMAGRCGLASHPTWTAAAITWPARTVKYKSLVGLVVVTKNIGSAKAGLRCTTSCNPAPYGWSNASNASAVYPNSVACDFAHVQGLSGKSGKYVGKSGCSHRFVLGAKFNATAKGVGLGVDVQIDWTGGVDQNGGAYTDTCGLF